MVVTSLFSSSSINDNEIHFFLVTYLLLDTLLAICSHRFTHSQTITINKRIRGAFFYHILPYIFIVFTPPQNSSVLFITFFFLSFFQTQYFLCQINETYCAQLWVPLVDSFLAT